MARSTGEIVGENKPHPASAGESGTALLSLYAFLTGSVVKPQPSEGLRANVARLRSPYGMGRPSDSVCDL